MCVHDAVTMQRQCSTVIYMTCVMSSVLRFSSIPCHLHHHESSNRVFDHDEIVSQSQFENTPCIRHQCLSCALSCRCRTLFEVHDFLIGVTWKSQPFSLAFSEPNIHHDSSWPRRLQNAVVSIIHYVENWQRSSSFDYRAAKADPASIIVTATWLRRLRAPSTHFLGCETDTCKSCRSMIHLLLLHHDPER